MNLLNFTIAFVVDGATGSHMVQTDYSAHQTDHNNAAVAQRHGSHLKFLPHGFTAISSLAQEMITAYKERVQGQKDMAHLLQFSHHKLRDIGLTHDDLVNLKSGLISLEALNMKRREYHG